MEVYASVHCRTDIVGDSYQFFNSPHCQHSEPNFDTNIKPDWCLSPDAKPKYQKSTTLAVNSVVPSYQCVGGQLSLNIVYHLITPTNSCETTLEFSLRVGELAMWYPFISQAASTMLQTIGQLVSHQSLAKYLSLLLEIIS